LKAIFMSAVQADTAIEGVTAGVAHAATAGDMSMIGMFMQADLVVKAVMISLLIASFWSWAIIFEKIARFKAIKANAVRFEQEFWASDALDQLYDRVMKKRASHPFTVVFCAAMEEWFRSGRNAQRKTAVLAASGIERISKIMSVSRNRELEQVEKGLGFLATVGSAAPFIGLFGTVWGIMNSFQSIAFSNNTSLAVVAPGIAEALLATAIGLFAAIPAVIAYNKFSAELGKFAGRMEDFEIEFAALISRQTEQGA
jgi:biopolymer transport protein TolQ